MRIERRFAALAAAALYLGPSSAFAYCRTTTCDSGGTACGQPDANGCFTTGFPLYWASQCLGFGVQKDGSRKLGITAAQADVRITAGYQQWMGASCNGSNPSFRMWDDGTDLVCNKPEYNATAPNANVWMFRDSDWPYKGATTTLALTTVTFAVKTGEILDADVELNSFGTRFVLTDTGPGTDLQSIATHESGHFLGLAHSNVLGASMFPQYSSGDRSFRTISADDVAGICAAYPPGRSAAACSSPSHTNGFSRDCAGADSASKGCSCRLASANRAPVGTAAALLLAVGALAVARRRRR